MSDDANPLEKITRERDEARAAADEWRARAESADKGYGQSFEEERDEARAQLATLREAATPIYDRDLSADERRAWWDRLERTLADIEAAARAHDARIRAAALRKAAERIESTPPTLLASASDWQRWLCEMADEAEKESR